MHISEQPADDIVIQRVSVPTSVRRLSLRHLTHTFLLLTLCGWCAKLPHSLFSHGHAPAPFDTSIHPLPFVHSRCPAHTSLSAQASSSAPRPSATGKVPSLCVSVRRRGYTAAASECDKVHACNFSNLITSLLVCCHERALKLLGSFSFLFFFFFYDTLTQAF